MAIKNPRRKRSNIAFLFLPALIFIFYMGWSQYWIGDQKRPKPKNRTAPKKDNVTLLPAVFEKAPPILI
ncbi:MAG TPA: hypothetical protein VJY36_07380 [Candidatus Bathyarchaeia archaeon]|nr:hypothetical protein [Candidatus Bathyarchaeia archaeon]